MEGATKFRCLTAAEGILKDPKGLAGSKELAVAILNLAAGEPGHDVIASDTAKIRLEIARRKRLIRLYPRDALLLTETAFLYTNLGMIKSMALLSRADYAPWASRTSLLHQPRLGRTALPNG